MEETTVSGVMTASQGQEKPKISPRQLIRNGEQPG